MSGRNPIKQNPHEELRGGTELRYRKTALTPAKKKFAQVYSVTDNAAEAVRQAYPELAKYSTANYIKEKGKRLVTNGYVLDEINRQKRKLEELSDRSIATVEKCLDSDDERVALRASMFVYEQCHGKSRQKLLLHSEKVEINLDLTGSTPG